MNKGRFGEYGGQFVPETLMNEIINLEKAYLHYKDDKGFTGELSKDTIFLRAVNEKFDVSLYEKFKTESIDYLLFDSGAGCGKTFNWDMLKQLKISKPWFLAGGINLDNIKQAMELNPFAVDVSSGAETDGVKDREKINILSAITHIYHDG